MTGRDDSTTDGDSDDTEETGESSDRSSSLEDLAETIKRRREGGTSPTNAPDIDLETDEEHSEADISFEWFTERGDDTEEEPEGTMDAIETASNVLVLDPGRGAVSDQFCIDLLTLRPVDGTDILFVTVTQSPDDRIAAWQECMEDAPASMTIISLGNESRTSEKSTKISTQSGLDDITIETLSDPSDLTRLGITLTRHLSEPTKTGSRTAVCLHSLTALLQYVEPQRLFRFLHILQGKLESHDTVAHYHIDPDTHEPQTIQVFESLFDAVVRITDDGDLEVVSSPE